MRLLGKNTWAEPYCGLMTVETCHVVWWRRAESYAEAECWFEIKASNAVRELEEDIA